MSSSGKGSPKAERLGESTVKVDSPFRSRGASSSSRRGGGAAAGLNGSAASSSSRRGAMLDLAGTARQGPIVQLNNLLPDFSLPAREMYRTRAQRGDRSSNSANSATDRDARDESPARSSPNALSKSRTMPMPGGAGAFSVRHRLLRVSASSESTLDLSDMTMTRGRMTSSLRRDASAKQMALAASIAAAVNAPFSSEIGAVPDLKTGEDAITYFAKNNDQTPLKFVQLNRAPGWNAGKNWKPYDLVVVREGETLQHEYFVFSAKGVMQFIRDPAQDKIAKAQREVTPTETLTLARFLFESTIFGMLRNMKTFKNYLLWKMLGRWKGSVRFAQFCRTRALIASRLFALKDIYRPLLQLAGGTMSRYKERMGSLFDLSMKRTMTLSQFTAQHTAHLEYASNELDEACLAVVKFAEELPMQLEDKLRMLHKELDDDDPYKKVLASMLEQRLQREGLLRDIEQTKQDQARLGDFLRMVDFVMVESLFQFARTSYNQFVNLCNNPPSSMRQGVFSTSLLLRVNPGASPDAAPEQAVRALFSPTSAAMNAGLDEAFDASLTVIDNMQRIMLPVHMQVSDGPGSLAALDHYLCRLRAGTRSMVESHYIEAREYAISFDKYKMNFSYADSFDEASFMDETSGMTWDELAEKLAEVNEWVLDVGKMRAEKAIGQLLLVESRGLKERMAMLLEEPLAVMKDRIVEAGRAKCQDLIDQFYTCNSNMMIVSDAPEGGAGQDATDPETGGGDPTSQGSSPSASPRISMDLMDQAIYIENLNQAEASKQHLMNEVEVVHTIYKTLAEYNVKVSIEDQTATDDLDESVLKFDQTIVLAHRYVKDQNDVAKDRLRDVISSLEKRCGVLTSQLMKEPFCDADMHPADVVVALGELHERVQKVQTKTEEAQKMSELFSGEEYTSGPLQSLNMVFEKKMSLWNKYNAWQSMWEGWLDANLEHLMVPQRSGTDFTAAALETAVDEAFAEVTKLSRKMKGDPIVAAFQSKVKYARDNIEMLVQVGHESLLPRHWTKIFSELGLTYDEKKPTIVRLKTLIDNGLFDPKNLDAMDEVCGTAGKEFSLLRGMESMEEEWASMDFSLQPYKETGTVILQGQGVIEEILDDQIVRTQAMRGSRFIGPFKERIEAWEVKLRLLEEIMTNWQKTQNVWLYLEPIFSSPDIRKQMPAEAKRFKVVDKSWREVMQACKEDPAVLAITQREGVVERFIKSNALLDQIQKGLADYLNKKRIFFPRFFFLSNDELLEILSETKDPRKVQPHLKKCFEGIVRVKFRDGSKEQYDILSMISAEKESVDLVYEPVGEDMINPDDAKGCVEIWLDRLQTVMRKSVAHIFDLAFEDYAKFEAEDKRTEWLTLWPGQLVLGVSQTYWTMGVEKALRGSKDDLKNYCVLLQKYITDIVEMVRSPKISKMVKKTISPLVVLDKHSLDSTQKLLDAGISSPVDFDWLSQLRYYYHPGGESAQTAQPKSVEVKIINAVRLYAYEYLGNSMRLVVTPLTDRCYRTLMTAIHLDYGGAPAGPAGTGKTETVKDLGKACAIQCVVYNCSDSLDYKAMGKFFKGLAGTGAWSCFDEFNRITLEVLSVVAQQILTIIHAKKALKDRFDFEGENVQLRRTCNVFVTMNPGYAGRQELPDNLKALVRNVAMMVPDYAMIGEIILYSMGYYEGKSMATKVVLTYKLCSEQLSNQRHYDYGMRAVVAVLITMGNLKRKFPDENEAVLCLRGIVDVNKPKFLSFDLPLFEGIVGDLFPGITLPDVDRAEMRTHLERHISANGLQPTDYFMGKVYEIYEMMCVRHGFMVVGQPFGGKTNALKMLAATMTTLHAEYPEDKRWHDTIYTIINPKSVTMDQLYGGFDPVSHEWSDGVLAITYRNYAAEPPKVGKVEDLKWVWFDGPVDAIWIENMNTVLDNNKKLCLMSGEMMAMSDTMSMIFEPMDLEVASPATVSRVGVIFLEPHRMGWKPCLQSWLDRITEKTTPVPAVDDEEKEGDGDGANGAAIGGDDAAAVTQASTAAGSGLEEDEPHWNLTKSQAALVHKLFGWLIDPCLSFVRKGCREVVTALDQQLVIGCMRLMESMFSDIMFRDDDQKKKIRKGEAIAPEITDAHIECAFLFSLVWSIGAITDEAGRQAFDSFLQEFMTDYEIINRPDLKGVNTLLLLRDWKYPLGEGVVYKWSIPMPCLGMPRATSPDGSPTGSPQASPRAANASVYDYCYEFHKNRWVTWHDTIDKTPIPHEAEFSSIVVPNLVTAQLGQLLGLLINHAFPPLVVGPTGTGKSVFIKQVITLHLDQDVFKTIPTSFTAKTSANDTQSVVDNALDKRRRGVYGPAFGCKAVVFVDDFNLPEVEEYGAQPPVELIRQFIDNGGWYDVVGGEMDFHQLEDTQLIAAMGPPGMGANDITPRMMRHFSAICITTFDSTTITQIYDSIMTWYMGSVGHSPDIAGMARNLVGATVSVYKSCMQTLLPTPQKSHYTFNLRDFSRIIQGITLLKPYEGLTEESMVRLWLHESSRVIMDRLQEEADKDWFLDNIGKIAERKFEKSLDDLIGQLNPEENGLGDMSAHRRLFFGTFRGDGGGGDEERDPYEELAEVNTLVPLIETKLEAYNLEMKNQMDLVIFVFAVEHVSRVSRVLAMPGGNALLVGVGGSGRQSLTRLAAFMAGHKVKQIALSKNYTYADWRLDLCSLLHLAGTGKTEMVFLLSDTQIKEEAYVEDVNSMLNTGQVPSIFEVDEKVAIIDEMRKILKQQGDPKLSTMTNENIFDRYVQRCRDRLHIVLAFSPIGDSFRERLRKFPAIINCCTIDWFFGWPKDALLSVAS
jgi:dynein heavy chain